MRMVACLRSPGTWSLSARGRQTYRHNGVHLADLSDEMCLHGCMPALRCHLCTIARCNLLACRYRCVQVGLWLVRGWGRHPPKEDESHFCVWEFVLDGFVMTDSLCDGLHRFSYTLHSEIEPHHACCTRTRTIFCSCGLRLPGCKSYDACAKDMGAEL